MKKIKYDGLLSSRKMNPINNIAAYDDFVTVIQYPVFTRYVIEFENVTKLNADKYHVEMIVNTQPKDPFVKCQSCLEEDVHHSHLFLSLNPSKPDMAKDTVEFIAKKSGLTQGSSEGGIKTWKKVPARRALRGV
jgi:hypothetical protein